MNPLTVRGYNFYDGDQPFTWVGACASLLHNRHLLGQDVRPILDEWKSLPHGGPNILSVMSMVGWGIQNYAPRFHANYYDAWESLIPIVQSYDGLRLQVLVFCSALYTGIDGKPMMPPDDELKHWQTLDTIFRKYAAGAASLGNEPYTHDNGPSHGDDYFGPMVGTPTSRSARGESAPVPYPGWDYNEYETTRTSDIGGGQGPNDLFPKYLFEASQAAQIFANTTNVSNPKPLVIKEPMAFADVPVNGRRSSSPRNAALMANQTVLWGMGINFWSDCGLQTTLLTPQQKACASEFFQAAWSSFV